MRDTSFFQQLSAWPGCVRCFRGAWPSPAFGPSPAFVPDPPTLRAASLPQPRRITPLLPGLESIPVTVGSCSLLGQRTNAPYKRRVCSDSARIPRQKQIMVSHTAQADRRTSASTASLSLHGRLRIRVLTLSLPLEVCLSGPSPWKIWRR